MNIRYLKSSICSQALQSHSPQSVDAIIVAGSHILRTQNESVFDEILKHSVRVLKATGILFVQGTPQNLPDRIEPLMHSLHFKYWIAMESSTLESVSGLPSVHAAVVVFAKSKKSFAISKVRFPHKFCSFCNKTLKDWGGKSHLMNPAGYALSDVWRDLPRQDNYTKLSLPVLEVLLRLLGDRDGACLIFPYEGIDFDSNPLSPRRVSCRRSFLQSLGQTPQDVSTIGDDLLDIVHCGDAIEILQKYPDNSVDLAFADPPYNLQKSYDAYQDEKEDQRYIDWCNAWLREYIRVLKPAGSLYIVNLPKWAIHHAAFLNKHLHFQNWIAWDAISEPRGKIMPAHYALLFYTKHPTHFTFNYEDVSPIDAPSFCLRPSCKRKRKEQGIDPKVPLTDIWWDVHRIKHKKDRDLHPCQLPDKLMERIVRLSSNKGDVVLDALCGAGTTAVAAYKLGRRFIAIDIDKHYGDITRAKIEQLKTVGFVQRRREKKTARKVTKKELQLELQKLASSLGRLPTEEDVRNLSQYDLRLFREAFPTWGKALKAAKLQTPH
jgi:site-specific DNA-methyltransferase (adenine-specific)